MSPSANSRILLAERRVDHKADCISAGPSKTTPGWPAALTTSFQADDIAEAAAVQPGGDIARRRAFRNNTTGAVDVVARYFG